MEQSTMYNACDTTALFLIAINRLIQLDDEYKYLLEAFKQEIEGALEYIFRHTENGYFIEDPAFSNTKSYCLKVTYWKDSIIFQRKNGEPRYPATYVLAHVQNMNAVRCMARLTESQELKEKADQMYARFQELYDPETKLFTSVFDEEGKLTDPNSDLLHMLYYLEPQDLSAEQLEAILKSCKHLETKIGYKTNRVMDQEHHQKLLEDTKKFLENPQKGDLFSEVYHYNSIWPFEQAFIHLGALKFGLDEVAEVSGRIKHHIKGTFPEVLLLNSQGKIFSFNCYLQLWTIAASEVFWKKDVEELIG
jgi:glycogen debranching enzyme